MGNVANLINSFLALYLVTNAVFYCFLLLHIHIKIEELKKISVRQGFCYLGYLAAERKYTFSVNNPGDSAGSSLKIAEKIRL